MQYLTAYGALIEIGKLTKDDVVVITAASSSSGLAAIQLANLVGATPIAATLGAHDRVSAFRLAGMPLIAICDRHNTAYTALLSEALAGIAFQGPAKISANDTSSTLQLR